MSKYRSLVSDDLGSPDGALVFDESGFVKKGQNSVGVASPILWDNRKSRQLPGGVFAGYVSEHGYALVDKRLFIPEKWFGDDYVERRTKCNLPAELVSSPSPNWRRKCSLPSAKRCPVFQVCACRLFVTGSARVYLSS